MQFPLKPLMTDVGACQCLQSGGLLDCRNDLFGVGYRHFALERLCLSPDGFGPFAYPLALVVSALDVSEGSHQ